MIGSSFINLGSVEGKTVFNLYSPKIAQSMTDDDQEVLKSGRPKLNIIEKYESASGIKWVQTDKVPIFDKNGIPVGLIGFAQDILKTMLTSMSFDVTTVGSGKAALKELENREGFYDLVLLDWRMPGMDGFETARWRYRRLQPPRTYSISCQESISKPRSSG